MNKYRFTFLLDSEVRFGFSPAEVFSALLFVWISDKSKEHNFFITDSEPSGGDFWRDVAGRL